MKIVFKRYLRNTAFLLCLLSFYALSSCEKYPDPISNLGVISGYVSDETSKKLSDVCVTACGAYGKSSTMTNSEGYYEFTGLGNGSYFLEFARKDMGTRRLYNLKIFGDEKISASISLLTLPGNFTMPEFVKASIGSMPRSYPVYDWIRIETNVTSTNRELYGYGFDFILFLGTREGLSCENYDLVISRWTALFYDNPITIYLEPWSLPFLKGQKVYVMGYAANKYESSDILDPFTGKPEFPTLNPQRHTNVVSFIMP